MSNAPASTTALRPDIANAAAIFTRLYQVTHEVEGLSAVIERLSATHPGMVHEASVETCTEALYMATAAYNEINQHIISLATDTGPQTVVTPLTPEDLISLRISALREIIQQNTSEHNDQLLTIADGLLDKAQEYVHQAAKITEKREAERLKIRRANAAA